MFRTDHARRLARLALATSALASVAPACAKTIAVTQANLAASLANAQPGDLLALAPGGYGVVTVPRKVWKNPIVIDASKATLAGIVIYRASGVTWKGGTVIGSIYGVSIRESSNVTVIGADISAALRGVVVNESTDIKLQKNKLHHLRSDGIDIVGQNILVEGNVISDIMPAADDHPDGVQIWSVAAMPSQNIIVRGNTITGNMQGIFARTPVIGVKKLTVTGNRVTVSYPNAIVLLDATNSVATGNVVKSPSNGIHSKANMRVEGVGNVACGNAVPDVPKAAPAAPCG